MIRIERRRPNRPSHMDSRHFNDMVNLFDTDEYGLTARRGFLRILWTTTAPNSIWHDDATSDLTEARTLIMTKNDFREMFQRALDGAAAKAETKLAKPVPRTFLIELHAPGSSGQVASFEEAINRLYLGSDRFYRIIDVAIKEVLPGEAVAFVRVSGHPPAEFSKTWDPSALGPFKEIIAENIDDRRLLSG